jgi:hypothetical protein
VEVITQYLERTHHKGNTISLNASISREEAGKTVVKLYEPGDPF